VESKETNEAHAKFTSNIVPPEEEEEYNRLMSEAVEGVELVELTPEEEESYLASVEEEFEQEERAKADKTASNQENK